MCINFFKRGLLQIMKKLLFVFVLIIWAGLCFAYNVGSRDELQITSTNVPEINGTYTVTPDGFITVQYAGRIKVEGKTVDKITNIITNILKKRINNPEIYINLAETRNSMVYVTGFISNPGAVRISNTTRLSNIIAQVGDIKITGKNNAAEEDIVFIIKSIDGKKAEIPYSNLIDCDYKFQNGDVINVELANQVTVNVLGKVNAPGRYTLSSKNNSIMGAVVAAGGFTDDADYGSVKMYDITGKGSTQDLSNLIDNNDSESNIALADNTTIIVPELIESVTVLGWVSKQGKQIYKPNHTIYLADVIANAGGGIRNKARFNEVYVLRNVNGEVTKTAYNFNNFQKKGDITGNPIIKRGDVVFMPCTTAIDWSEVMSAIRGVVGIGRDIGQL